MGAAPLDTYGDYSYYGANGGIYSTGCPRGNTPASARRKRQSDQRAAEHLEGHHRRNAENPQDDDAAV